MVIFFLSLLLSSSTIDSKIREKKKELSSQKVEYDKMDKKLSTMALKIMEAKEEKSILSQKIGLLKININKHKDKYKELQEKQKIINQKLEELIDEITRKQETFVSLVAEKFSMALVLEELNQPSSESIMLQETYAIYAKENEEQIRLLKEDITALKIKEEYFQNKKENIQRVMGNYESEREEYKSKQYEKTLLLKALAGDKAIYRKRFDKIRSTQRALRHKLSSLKIVKQDKARDIREAKQLAKAQEIEALQLEREQEINRQRTASLEELPTVEELEIIEPESSPVEVYKEEPIAVATHHGKKTISPLTDSRLIKKFGTYIDPIYKFKIFNKSITLKSSHKGAKVKSILRGRVVFAEDSGGMLGRVVIIEHDNQLHTIYAKLARLAPGIHVGKQVSKGSVLGKVNKSLMFEVTKNNKHMNPLKLIRL